MIAIRSTTLVDMIFWSSRTTPTIHHQKRSLCWPLLALPFLLQSAAAAPIGARAPLDVRPETFRHYCEPKQSSSLDFTHTTVNK